MSEFSHEILGSGAVQQNASTPVQNPVEPSSESDAKILSPAERRVAWVSYAVLFCADIAQLRVPHVS